jgi:hypothetical protein
MKYLSVILLAYFIVGVQAKAGIYTPPSAPGSFKEISLNGHESCELADNAVNCWGGSFNFEVPPLRNPKSVSGGVLSNCALDDDGVHCWGLNNLGQLNVPRLKNPKLMSSFDAGACALDDNGISCWGASHFNGGESRGPSLKHPQIFVINDYNLCALDDIGVRCWGDPNDVDNINSVPKLSHPKFVSLGPTSACAIDDRGLHCWGRDVQGQTKVPALNNAKSVSVGHGYACAIDDDGVHCWGGSYGKKTTISRQKGDRSIFAGYGTACVIGEDGARCWQSDSYDHPKPLPSLAGVPKIKHPGFNLDQIHDLDLVLAQVSGPARARYFSRMDEFVESALSSTERSADLNSARYLLVKLFSPAILTNDSSYFVQTLIPGFQKSMVDIERELGFGDLSAVSSTSLAREVALHSIQATISVMSDFLSPEDRAILQPTLQALGLSIMGPTDNDKLQNLFVSLDNAAPVIKKLETNPKSAFLVQALRLGEEWLKGSR